MLTPPGGASRATDVQTLLTSFSAGVQRGLDEARERSGRPPVDAGPAAGNGLGNGHGNGRGFGNGSGFGPG